MSSHSVFAIRDQSQIRTYQEYSDQNADLNLHDGEQRERPLSYGPLFLYPEFREKSVPEPKIVNVKFLETRS